MKDLTGALCSGRMEKVKEERKYRRLFISVFIFFHLMIMALWGLPGSNFRTRMVRWMEGYIIHSGLWHSWDMFSPDPLSLNFNLVAQISYQDGSKKEWEFPRMEKLSLWEKHHRERQRKWRERVRLDAYQVLWGDTARWIAREHDTPTNHPQFVSITRHWGAIPPPNKKQDYQPMLKTATFQNNYTFYVHPVTAEDLRK